MVQKQIASSFDYKRKEMLNKPITTLKKERIQAIRITPDTISKAYPPITYKCVVGKSLVKSKNPNTNKAISLKEL